MAVCVVGEEGSELPWRKLGTVQSGSELPHSKTDPVCPAKKIWDTISPKNGRGVASDLIEV